jgi:CHAT domain-containing protein
VLNNVAIYYRTTEDYETAKDYYLRAMKITLDAFGKEHIDYALSLNNLAQLYSKQSNYKKAKELLLESKAITFNNYAPTHPESVLALSNLADVSINLHQVDSAEFYALESLRLNAQMTSISDEVNLAWQEKLCSQQPSSYIHMLESLQALYKVERNRYHHTHKSIHLQKARIIAQTALQLADQYRHRFTTDSDKLYLLERSVKWTYKAIQSTIEIAEQEKIEDFEARAFAFAEQNKSVLLSEAVQNDKAHIFGDLPDSLAQKERLLQEEYSSLQAELLDSKSEEDKLAIRSKINDLNQEIEQFKAFLEKNYPKYNALKYSKNQVSTKHIQELLDEETALIEYVVADSIVYIFCVDKTHFELYQQKITKNQLSKQVADLRKALSDYKFIKSSPKASMELYLKTAYWFYENLLEPAIHHENIKHLLIIPDGELGHLPFEAFLTQSVESHTADYKKLPYLLHDFKISYDYSASLWDENEQTYEKVEHQAHRGLVLACAASYNQKDSSTARSEKLSTNLRQIRQVLGDLPAAKAEVEGLAKKFKGTFLYGNAANESFFKDHANEYGVIHLAMHGLLDEAHPILSSLAFTENGDSLEDNFLRAYEIVHLNLNAELVVLSACETGYGKFEEGEGVISLARSFMYAGVPSLVVSMWEVNDQSTAKIMMLFYENLSKRMDKAKALQKAKIDYLQMASGIAAHPAFWAAFIQLGDHHPVHLKSNTSGVNRWWWFAIGFGVLTALSAGFRRLRKPA